MLIDKIQSNRPYFIAEMSANHGGSLENALKIVRLAKKHGADCLKIQTYTPDSMTIESDSDYFRVKGGLWDGYTLYGLYEEAHTPWEWQRKIKAECDSIGIDFLSTAFDAKSADFLETIGVRAYKIASFELVDIPLIRHVAQKAKPMIISCGMGSEDEIRRAVNAARSGGLDSDEIFLLKCTSEYPADPSYMNLLTIPDMAARFGVRTGLSDHSMGSMAAVVGASLGAVIIEKHFCLSRSLKSPDSAFSMEPEEFAAMVKDVAQAAKIKGNAVYGPTGSEKSSLVFRRSLFVVEDIEKGGVFTTGNIRSIRPGRGLPPMYYDTLIGRRAKQSYKRGQPITSIEIEDGDSLG